MINFGIVLEKLYHELDSGLSGLPINLKSNLK
jgi:hypothetical protein